MLNISDLFKEKKFPGWFTKHPIFKEVKQINKVFPSIGLPNCEEEIQLESRPAREAAKRLLQEIDRNLGSRNKKLKTFCDGKPEMSAERKVKSERIFSLIKTLRSFFNEGSFIKEHNNRLTLKIPADVFVEGDARPVFREGESLFRVYNKLNDLLREGSFAKMPKLEDMHSFKTFSTENVPNSRYKIIFSSDGINGAWDIATMSMRGVSSCQSWGGEYCHHTIGSVIDPFVGIIYLTSGAKFNEHGTKMMRRCIVRFAINEKDKKPVIILDNMYPACDNGVLKQFKDFIKTKSGGKFEVEYAPTMGSTNGVYMPLTPLRKKLNETNRQGDERSSDYSLESIASYQDFAIIDKVSAKNDKLGALFEKNATKKARLFVKEFESAFVSAIKDIDLAEFPDSVKPAIRKLKGGDKHHFSYTYVVPGLAAQIANSIVKRLDKSDYPTSDLYHRRLYYTYLSSKDSIYEDIKVKLTREINSKLHLKDNKIKSENCSALMKLLMPKIDQAMKTKLKELVDNRKISTKQIPVS